MNALENTNSLSNWIENTLLEFLKHDTQNPPGNEKNSLVFLKKICQKHGAETDIIIVEKRPNIIAKWGSGKERLAIVLHSDTVPIGTGWTKNPFGESFNGAVYGRGAQDDKGPFVAALAAVSNVRNLIPPGKGIDIVICADEERGSEKGMKALLKQGYRWSAAFVPDAGDRDTIVVGEKGLLWLKLKVTGKQAHGSTPKKGVNAILFLTEWLREIITIQDTPGDPIFSPLTVNVGQIEGGTSPNMVPAKASAILDFRIPPPLTKEWVINKIETSARFTEKKIPAQWKIDTPLQSSTPHRVRHEIVELFKEAAKQNGIRIDLETIGGNTIAKYLNEAGIPAFCHAPQKPGTSMAHEADENISVEDLTVAAAIWTSFLENWLKVSNK